jgi:anaerobic ribonucleoside-triphosphate reductase
MVQKSNGDMYFRLENCSRIINFAGFTEAVESFCGKSMSHEETVQFAEEIAQNLLAFKRKLSRRHSKRLFPTVLGSLESSVRLAHLDIEKYGVAKVKFSGTRDSPFYSTTKRLKLKHGDFPYVPSEALELEHKLKGLNDGGSLSIIDLEDKEYQPEQLLKLTEQLIKHDELEFFTYNRVTTYCDSCRKSWFGSLHKCPSCGSMGTLTTLERFART